MIDILVKIGFSFDLRGLLLFVVIMIPNIIWFKTKQINDVLSKESLTPLVDKIGSIAQFIMIVLLIIPYKISSNINLIYITLSIICLIIYLINWIAYFKRKTSKYILFSLAIFPCFSFIFYMISRVNIYALVPTIIYTITHIIFAYYNYIKEN